MGTIEESYLRKGWKQVTGEETATAESTSITDQLVKLGELRKSGLLTEAEFESQKRKVMGV